MNWKKWKIPLALISFIAFTLKAEENFAIQISSLSSSLNHF